MASSSQLFVLIAIAAALLPSTMAIQHIVGDDKGWTPDFNYSAWAKDKVFYLGDTLVFNYTAGKHDVVKVDGAGFANCTVPANPVVFITGNDVIPLKTPGKKWYICSVDDHCSARMQKLVIQVMAVEAPAPAPYTTTTTPPPPPSSDSAGRDTSIRFLVMMAMMVALVIANGLVRLI